MQENANMPKPSYDPSNPSSIFHYSKGLINKSLAQAVMEKDPDIKKELLFKNGKGKLGQLVEKFYFGYEPNNSPDPDFSEAGVELKTTPLKKLKNEELAIKERLVCDMIDYQAVVNTPFEESAFYRKSLLMLILFYLHEQMKPAYDLQFLYSVLWQLKEKDLLIIKQDYEFIINKIKEGKAHELSEGDTMYLGACRKGQKGESPRSQPFSPIMAPRRAFSLKPSYMRSILEFIQKSGKLAVSNTEIADNGTQLVDVEELRKNKFEKILTERFKPFEGKDYKQIAEMLNLRVSASEKSKYGRIAQNILHRGLRRFEDAEEIRKAGIIAKAVRIELNGTVKESMSFENINFQEVLETPDWEDSRWYEIATSKFMFVVFKAVPSDWKGKTRYVFDRLVFWTMPPSDLDTAKEYWENIRQNVLSDTLESDNTFWKISTHRNFHVRPKAKDSKDCTISPISGKEVPKKCYWFNRGYVAKILN